MAYKIFKLLSLLLLPWLFAYCGMGKHTTGDGRGTVPDTLRFEKQANVHPDSIEYELIVLDPGFDSWYMARNLGDNFYSLAYLENWNRTLTIQWNSLIGSGMRSSCRPEWYLDYDSGINYGLKLNHQLYQYFWYAHEKCRLFSSHPSSWRR